MLRTGRHHSQTSGVGVPSKEIAPMPVQLKKCFYSVSSLIQCNNNLISMKQSHLTPKKVRVKEKKMHFEVQGNIFHCHAYK